MSYTIVWEKSAKKAFLKLPLKTREAIFSAISALAQDPFPFGYIQLTNQGKSYRIRIGNYRVIYSVNNGILQILILQVEARKSVYKNKK